SSEEEDFEAFRRRPPWGILVGGDCLQDGEIMERVRDAFEQALAEVLPGQGIQLERPRAWEHGDLAFPCFKAAKALGKNPAQLAQELAPQVEVGGAECV